MDTCCVPGPVVCPFYGLLGDGSHLESLMHNKQLLFFVTPWLFSVCHRKQNILPVLYVQSWKLLKNPFQEPQFLPGFVSDFIVLYFCATSQSQRTRLVKNLNQISESQQSSSPPLFSSAPLPPGRGNHQSWGATTKLFPEPISCWTVCYTLSNIPKIILISKLALIDLIVGETDKQRNKIIKYVRW